MSKLDLFVAKVLHKHGLVSRQQIVETSNEVDRLEASGQSTALANVLVQKNVVSKEKAQWAVRMAQLEQFRRAEVMYANAAKTRGLPVAVVDEALEQQKKQRFQVTVGQLLRKSAALTPEMDGLIRKEVMEQLRTNVLTLDSVLGPELGLVASQIEAQNVEVHGYKRSELIAESANSAVYQAQRLADGKVVAVKFQNPACQATPDQRAEADRIAKSALRLGHPNIVHIFDIGNTQGFPYVVMEYVEGETIAETLEEYGAFDFREVQNIATQVAGAIQHAGEQFKLMHGNIKPDNIIVNRHGVAKLLDYGTLKPSPVDVQRNSALTLGICNYFSPEMARGEKIDLRADVYSLGVTLFHMLSGTMPFEAPTHEEVLARVLDEQDDLPELFLDSESEPSSEELRFAEAIEDMTQFNPDFRLQDATEVMDKLQGQNQTLAIPINAPPQLQRATGQMRVPQVAPSRAEIPVAAQGSQLHRPEPLGSQLQRPSQLSRPEAPAPAFGISRPEMPTSDGATGSSSSDNGDGLVGSVMFKRYKFLKLLGEGGMGKVYKTEHTMLRRIRAVKLIQPHLIGSEENLERFKREIMLQSRFQHPNVVQIYDAGNDKEYFYMAMECVEGVELSDILERDGALTAKRVISFMRQVLDALEAAHANKIIHRDLKTENIMITKDKSGEEIVKIMDFGIARLMENKDNEVYQTMAGRISGTPQYMSPEQCSGDETDERSDLYSLGIIFYELLAGELPFKAANAMGYIGLQILQPPPPFKELNPELEVHEELERVVMKCLEKKKEDRYQSAREILDDLEKNVLPAIDSKGGSKKGFWAWLTGLFGGGKKKE